MASIAKIVEISAESSKSFEDAVQQGITRAKETIQGIQNVWVQDQIVVCDDGNIRGYRVHLKVTFVLK